MMMMMILRMRVLTYFDKAHFYLVQCWFIIGLVPGCRSVLCMRDTRRTKRENVNKLPLSINDELLHTSDLLTRNIEPKSKIWRKSNCQPDQLFLRLLSFSLLINVPVWPIILCSMPCHPVYCKQFFWMTNPPALYFDRHNNPLQCWIIQQHFFLETDFKLNYKPMCHNCQGGKKKMSQNSISKVLRQNFLWYGKRYWLHKFKFASKFETLETDVFHLSANLPIWSFQKPSSSIKH